MKAAISAGGVCSSLVIAIGCEKNELRNTQYSPTSYFECLLL